MRVWSPLWIDIFDEDDIQEYKQTIMNMMMAAINWVESNPGIELKWEEDDKRAIMDSLGVPREIEEDDIILYGEWDSFFHPTEESQDFFSTIVKVCGEHTPTISMMEKAVNAGFLVWKEGWDYFNIFMSGQPDSKPN